MFPKIYMLYIYYYMYTKAFLLCLIDKGLRKNIKKKVRNREIGKHKLNEMGALKLIFSSRNYI